MNRFSAEAVTDVVAALDQAQQRLPNLTTVAIFVAWFGDDVRVGSCRILPRTESRFDASETEAVGGNSGDLEEAEGEEAPAGPAPLPGEDLWTGAGLGALEGSETAAQNTWRVSGLTLDDVPLISGTPRGPAYGATPSDRSVVRLIEEIGARGLRVMFHPFVMMDVPADNTLPDPRTGETGQPPYPWRGRITCDPAPGVAGTVDKTPAAGAQVEAFFGDAQPAQFGTWDGITIPYSGSALTGGYRRFVLHCAKLCQTAGGVDDFLVGSELVGITTVREAATVYPATAALVSLIGDVRSILPGARVSYAADWSEYHSHRPDDGSGDVLFPLDPVWAAADFVGIDNYLPLSDWRPGFAHADYDAADGPRTVYDLAYLRSGVEGGEWADWFYASPADREAQVRTAVEDLGHGEDWIFGNKAIRGWWNAAHHPRPGGVRPGAATPWVPRSKPVIFTEFGCPSVDLGPNQPNVFIDPKSSESFAPYFSTAAPDQIVQRQSLKAFLGHWTKNAEDDGATFLGLGACCAYCWDARPYPAFPRLLGVWSDGPEYETGHWLTGRLGAIEVGVSVRPRIVRSMWWSAASASIAPRGADPPSRR